MIKHTAARNRKEYFWKKYRKSNKDMCRCDGLIVEYVNVYKDNCFFFLVADQVLWSPDGQHYVITYGKKIDVYSIEVCVFLLS